MFAALGRLASRRPWHIIAAWLVFAGLVIAFAPQQEATTDQSEFLPRHYESIKAAEILAKAFPDTNSAVGGIIVFDREDGDALTPDDVAAADTVMNEIQGSLGSETFDGVQPLDPENPEALVAPSEDGKIAFSIIALSDGVTGAETSSLDAVEDLRADLKEATDGTDLRYGVTGPLAQGYDSVEASGNALAIVGAATILLIVVLLALIFRSVIIALLPIVIVFIVSQVSTGLIAWANDVFDLKASSDVEVILLVVLYGIGTDYILFFLFRYRERLRAGEATRDAVAHALARAGEAIASAGGARSSSPSWLWSCPRSASSSRSVPLWRSR